VGRDGAGVTIRPNSIRLSFTLRGKTHRETLTLNGLPMAPTAANIKHAHRVIAEIRGKIKHGTFVLADYFPDSPHAGVGSAVTKSFGDMGDLWLKTKGRLAPKTKNQYRNAMGVWKALLGADTPMNELTHGTVAAKIGSTDWASAKLLNNYLIVLRGVFALAARELKVDNAIDGIENSPHQGVPPDPLSTAEMELVLRDLKKHYSPQVWAYFEFAFMTGLRPEEAIALRWSDIDWNNGTARVERARTAEGVKAMKTYQSRDVDLVERAIAALKVQKEHTFLKDGEIFANPVTGKPWHDERSQRDHYWKPSLRRCGIRARRAYQTRHTYATNALAGGVNPTYVSRQMGHKNAKMLFTIYAKWIDGADRGREKAKLEAMLKGAEIAPESPQELKVLGRRDWTRTKIS